MYSVLRRICWIGCLIPPLALRVVAEDGQLGETSIAEFSADSVEWFERQVRPLLLEKCSSCHSQAIDNMRGSLSLDSRDSILAGGDSGPAIVPGKPSESLLIEAVHRESFEMPPEKPLSSREIQILEKWVSLGAPWTDPRLSQDIDANTHWAWRSISSPTVPASVDDHWSLRPLDSFVFSKLTQNDLVPAEPADNATLLRRLSFDLTGLPPNAWFDGDASLNDEADYERCVDRLLSSTQFGVHWGRHWLDVVRYAETLGHEFDYPVHDAWRYRDAVMDALNTDVPYSRFATEHLIGDQVAEPRRNPLTGINDSLALTGWWWLGDSVHAPVDITSDWATRLDNQIDVASKAFLGMTVACARCHDHKFDAISTQDYYGLSAVIESSRRAYRFTDPLGNIESHCSSISDAMKSADDLAAEVYAQLSTETAEQWLNSVLEKLAKLEEVALGETISDRSPLSPLRVLAKPTEDLQASLVQELKHLERLQSDYDRWLEESAIYADFSQGLPSGWTSSTPATISQDSRFDWFSSALPLPSRRGIFSSQTLGKHQFVTLRSPDFPVVSNAVCIKMRGKSTQSSLVVSNYFMQEFHNLLFGDLRKPIDQPDDSGWVVHAGDLNKYIGHTAYISIEDEDQAWFEIEQVRFADGPPPMQPSKFAIDLMQSVSPNPNVLRDRLAEEISLSLRRPEISQSATLLAREVVRLSIATETSLPLPELTQVSNTLVDLNQTDASSPAPARLLTIEEGTPKNGRVAIRGNPHERGDPVARVCLASHGNYREPARNSSGRAEFANALTDPSHPLTSRVLVARVWHHLVGSGLVDTPDNLGVLGARPHNAELLDYLASEFMAHDWSLKWLIREIVTSQTYRLSSQASERQMEIDPDSRLLSHRQVRRLTAESLRDSILMTAKSLDPQVGGRSVPVFLTDGMTGRGRPKDSGPLDGQNRRTSFIEVRRNFLDPFLLAFDFPLPATTQGKRNTSNVPAQALGLLNAELVDEMAARWAQATASIADDSERVRSMIQSAFSRPATDEELRRCLEFTEGGTDEVWVDLAHVLFNSKEFSFLR